MTDDSLGPSCAKSVRSHTDSAWGVGVGRGGEIPLGREGRRTENRDHMYICIYIYIHTHTFIHHVSSGECCRLISQAHWPGAIVYSIVTWLIRLAKDLSTHSDKRRFFSTA